MFYYHLPCLCAKVKFHLFTTEEGGRKSGIEHGYRPDHLLSNNGVLTMGPMYFEDQKQEVLNIGESAEMQVFFLVSEISEAKVKALKKGDKWKVFEGKRCVGECEMIGDSVTKL